LINDKSFGSEGDKTENHLNFFLIFIDAQIFSCHSAPVIDQFSSISKGHSIANKDFVSLSFFQRSFSAANHQKIGRKLSESCHLFFKKIVVNDKFDQLRKKIVIGNSHLSFFCSRKGAGLHRKFGRSAVK